MFGCRCCVVEGSDVTVPNDKPTDERASYSVHKEHTGAPEDAHDADVAETAAKATLAANPEAKADSAETAPETFLVELRKEAGTAVGMDLVFHKRTPVEVQSVKKGCLIDLWNEKNASKQVSPGDLILELNGEPFRPKTIKEVAGLFAQPAELNLLCKRGPGGNRN
mmetsp:Transcript_59031/g.140985  ORF Transcript_59031/g.140985 Transcript_59031/m.140985 type:complete len:166 (-) Transcript_59031:222-719(-)